MATKEKGAKCTRPTARVGLPGAVAFSLLIHAGLFLLAGALVVFNPTPKKEVPFKPPPSIRCPKMPLRKLKVTLKKNSRPRSSAPIVAPVTRINLSDIQLPILAGSGLENRFADGGVGGFENMPGLDDAGGVLGSGQTIGNDLEGTFYDFKRNRRGGYTGAGNRTYKEKIRYFMHCDWKPSALSSFYRSPRKIYATMIVVPPCSSAVAPAAFGEDGAMGRYWMIHYKGALVHGEDIVFRFWGSGDEVLSVRVDGEVVLAACWDTVQMEMVGDLWQTHSTRSRRYYMGNNRAVVGDWITLEAGVPREMEVLLGDNGGEACAMLAVEVKGVEYERNRQGGPILPAFRTSVPSRGLLDAIYKDLPVGEICLTNGPVFSDY
ncbi:MAG: hypothetical protein KAU94_02315 [Verrucomicrobia bacterium]|nr:hypothetical protein [Verrucomicrobiota bacterium]